MRAHSHHSHDHRHPAALSDPRYRRVLWAALLINAAIFGVEVAGGLSSGSVSLLADAVDFFGDAVNYGLSLAVLGMGLLWRARAALLKGLSMGLFGVFVLGRTVWALLHGIPLEPLTIGLIAAPLCAQSHAQTPSSPASPATTVDASPAPRALVPVGFLRN